MFNFLASQHRVLPEGATCDEEEDEVQLRSTRYAEQVGVLGLVRKGPKEDAWLSLDTSLHGGVVPTRRATSLELPMAMRFRHLKKTSKEAVGVYRLVGLGRGWGAAWYLSP